MKQLICSVGHRFIVSPNQPSSVNHIASVKGPDRTTKTEQIGNVNLSLTGNVNRDENVYSTE